MADFPRLIEFAFPLKQASLDSVHEKNVRHGHISTLHIWPARRPLAACRAALIATLLPDPGTPEKRKELCEKIGGRVVKRTERKKMPNGSVVTREKEETEGGILHWKRETENAETLEWFRQEIRKAYGGRAPKVLDPFAGGGAIPLEAMRLGCEATAIDINPVAWFILKCTLEYPQKLAGQKRPLPAFILKDRAFMESFFKAQGLTKAQIRKALDTLDHDTAKGEQMTLDGVHEGASVEADLAWHVRAWGQWVLARARRDLARFYPVYADYQPLTPGLRAYEEKPMQLVPLREDGTPAIDALNEGLSPEYLADRKNPRWIAKPTVAYLWARTVKCKNCRAEVPLLKTRWLCRKDKKRVLLTMEPNTDRTGVDFGVRTGVPVTGGNAAQRRENDKRLGAGTMSRAGAKCRCCQAETIMTMEDIRLEGKAGRLGAAATVVIVGGPKGKEYREPTEHELACAAESAGWVDRTFADIPFGLPKEPTPAGGGRGACRAFSIQGYGMMEWRDLFSTRQLLALGVLVRSTRAAKEAMIAALPDDWATAVQAYLAIPIDKVAAFNCTITRWFPHREGMCPIFSGYRIEMMWDYGETNPLSTSTGAYGEVFDWLGRVLGSLFDATRSGKAAVVQESSQSALLGKDCDLVLTDPPYYDAIPYSDLMDFFYVWLRRTLHGLSGSIDSVFATPLCPKWDHQKSDGELIDDDSRHAGDAVRSKQVYEVGMARVFGRCHEALGPHGRMVVVFAHKQPDAWDTLVSAIIRAGFAVDGSWPIQTEMGARSRALASAALASSVWLVCRKRPATAVPGWDTQVLEEMRRSIATRLREFWDAGIRGPDFVWAATGPAMEAYSKHPVVKKADQPNQVMTVSEFLNHVRRIVVDFVVGRVLSGGGGDGADALADRLDEPTAYYLLHRHDFGMDDAPIGACILYAISCGLSDSELADTWDLLVKTGDSEEGDEADAETSEEGEGDDEPAEAESGNKVKLKAWNHRRAKSMGYEAPSGRPVPLIDRIHRLMHLWKGGDLAKVDEYLDEYGLRRHELFKRLLQSLIELAEAGSDERSLLESLSNHVGAKGAVEGKEPELFAEPGTEEP